MTGYVLAGGRSVRMGRDKALIALGRELLVEHALRRLRPVCRNVAILSGPPDHVRDETLRRYGRLVPDLPLRDAEVNPASEPEEPALPGAPHHGPLAAVVAALSDCKTSHALLLAVDQPGVGPSALQGLVDAGLQSGAGVTFFHIPGSPEPLPMLLKREIVREIGTVLEAGERRLLSGTVTGAARMGLECLAVPCPSQGLSFENLNTAADLEQWQQGTTTSNHSPAGASE